MIEGEHNEELNEGPQTIRDKFIRLRTNRNFSIKEANGFFIILAVLFLTVGAYVQMRELISGLLITEFGLLAFPVILYSMIMKKDLRRVFRLKWLPASAVFKIIILAALLLPAIAVANLASIFIIELFGNAIESTIPTASSGPEFLLLFAVIAGSAGICEELFFRGAILNGYESELGMKWGAVFSGLLFGIFHFNPQNIFGPIILGIVFSYLVQLTGSIFAGIIAHMTNNGIAVTMGYLMNVVSNGAVAESDLIFESAGAILGVMAFYLVIGMICYIGVRAILKKLRIQFPSYVPVEGTDDFVEDIGPLWGKEPLKIDISHFFPIALSVVIYGFIIYVAYF